jgi:hypothetical protein
MLSVAIRHKMLNVILPNVVYPECRVARWSDSHPAIEVRDRVAI